MKLLLLASIFFTLFQFSLAQPRSTPVDPASLVNVFLGSEGDHGQMSPAAGTPFGMLSIGPQTYPNLHMGYDHRATRFQGFTHTRMEGVECTGSGGSILITPFLEQGSLTEQLLKATESAGPGYYEVGFRNGIGVKIAVTGNSGIEEYLFPSGSGNGFRIDLTSHFGNAFVAEEHETGSHIITGWIDARTTCNAGQFRLYYSLRFDREMIFRDSMHHLIASPRSASAGIHIQVGLSSVDRSHAARAAGAGDLKGSTVAPLMTYANVRTAATSAWNRAFADVQVDGTRSDKALFYSMLYRTMQSPYRISEPDGQFRDHAGILQKKRGTERYNGWAIWDNYRTQLPLLGLLDTARYQSMIQSIAGLYRTGKKDYATQNEPSNTVRTEHAMVVLQDAVSKGYQVDIAGIIDSVRQEAGRLDFSKPDKALESSYDLWALSRLYQHVGNADSAAAYEQRAGQYAGYWNRDFRDLTKSDVDRVSARGLYQGTIWQYRWFVPFDVEGLIRLAGGEAAYRDQLDEFFRRDLYNHANEPDIQVPLMYNMTSEPWKSQELMHRYAADTVVQYYFNDNSRGIDPFIGKIYTNRPDTYVRTMDDDAGAMSAWYIFAAMGFSPACVGTPVYYLHVPLFRTVILHPGKVNRFRIRVNNPGPLNYYIRSVTLNGKPIDRNWITQQEILAGGEMIIEAGPSANRNWGLTKPFITRPTDPAKQ